MLVFSFFLPLFILIFTYFAGVPKDIYLYANCLYLTRQYHRAINVLKKYKLLVTVDIFINEFCSLLF